MTYIVSEKVNSSYRYVEISRSRVASYEFYTRVWVWYASRESDLRVVSLNYELRVLIASLIYELWVLYMSCKFYIRVASINYESESGTWVPSLKYEFRVWNTSSDFQIWVSSPKCELWVWNTSSESEIPNTEFRVSNTNTVSVSEGLGV